MAQQIEHKIVIDTPTRLALVLRQQPKECVGESKKYIVEGVFGRVMHGYPSSNFDRLSYENLDYKRLVFVAGPDILQRFIGKTVPQMLRIIGFDMQWVQKRVREGVVFKLALFPGKISGKISGTSQAQDQLVVPATWHYLQEQIRELFPELEPVLSPMWPHLNSTPYSLIDPTGRMRQISQLSMSKKLHHAEFITTKRLLAIKNPNLYDARAFLYHSVGLNFLFTGTGRSEDPVTGLQTAEEYIMPNLAFDNIPGHVVLNLDLQSEEHGEEINGFLVRQEALQQQQVTALGCQFNTERPWVLKIFRSVALSLWGAGSVALLCCLIEPNSAGIQRWTQKVFTAIRGT